MATESFEERLRLETIDAEAVVYSFLPSEEDEARIVIEALNYSVRAGGKRLRPILMSETYKLFAHRADDGRPLQYASDERPVQHEPDGRSVGDDGGIEASTPIERALHRFMAAIEYIHTYSLVHDDLPAMDNDMLRRGKPTTHAAYGEAMAILAGDALLNYAYETAIGALTEYADGAAHSGIGSDGIDPDVSGTRREPQDVYMREYHMRVGRALALLSEKAGIYGMVGGQCVDVESEKTGAAMTRGKLDYIYENKTGALLTAAMGIGAILGGAGEAEYLRICHIASQVGLAFQIRDDILDATGDEETLGKPVGSDERNEKATYVAFEGIEQAGTDVRRLTGEAIEELRGLRLDSDFLEELLLSLIDRDR